MKPILEVQKISKKYRIEHLHGGYQSLRERMLSALKFERNEVVDFWALKDVSFEVQPGESIGIIGRNGAGKSTLLKVLSKITPPTHGRIVSRGRIASLLEVGTGFHPELTGRENIFFNGSLLGMKRKEIEVKFDEIVDFSGVEQFLDTPLKHYSSGMQLRLAFAVAAFLEPEILIIDEVLAVGDAEFQKKCMGKMNDVSKSGRTIIFVSHDLNAIRVLCSNTILLENGIVRLIEKTPQVLSLYTTDSTIPNAQNGQLKLLENRSGNGKIRFTSISIVNKEILVGGSVSIVLGLMNYDTALNTPIYLAVSIFNDLGVKLITLDNLYSAQVIKAKEGQFSVRCEIQSLDLIPGKYSIDLWCADHFVTFDNLERVVTFDVSEVDIYGTGRMHTRELHGQFILKNKWSEYE